MVPAEWVERYWPMHGLYVWDAPWWYPLWDYVAYTFSPHRFYCVTNQAVAQILAQ